MASISDLQIRLNNTVARSSQVFIRTESINTGSTSRSIDAVDTSNDYFQVNDVDLSGNAEYNSGNKIFVDGSTGNDAIFEIDSISTGDFDNQADGTDSRINVKESIVDGTADGSIYPDKDYTYTNFGRVKETSFSYEPVTSDADQDGRTSTQLFEITISLTLQQGSNTELSIVPDLDRPSPEGSDTANLTNYPRGYDFYQNGHFIYFSGDSTISTSQVNNAVLDDTDDSKDGELQTETDISGSADIHEDLDGFLLQNVVTNTGPDLDLSGGQSVLPVEINGRITVDELDSLDTDRKINVSPSSYYSYA